MKLHATQVKTPAKRCFAISAYWKQIQHRETDGAWVLGKPQSAGRVVLQPTEEATYPISVTGKISMRPNEQASVQDWRRLRASLLSQERQLHLQLRQVAGRVGSIHELAQQRAQLSALRELCEVLLDRSPQEHRQAGMHTSTVAPPDDAAAGILEMESSQARLRAKRAEHTILVVDDHPPTLYAATRLLKRAGYGVMEATTGEEAMLLSARASALLLDVNLPDTNGVAVCQAVKRTTMKPVILMSAVFTDALHQSAGLGAGADRYLTSLLDGAQLASSFDQLLASPA